MQSIENILNSRPVSMFVSKQQKRPIAKPLSEIAAQHQDRKTAIIAAYKTGAYSQREIWEFYQLHPTTVGVILRKSKNS
jgi:hypothetical protein